MEKINMRLFSRKVAKNKSSFRRFLSKLENNPPRGLDLMAVTADMEMWKKTDCLSCANCCKTMSPTYTRGDMVRIAAHIGMTLTEFQKRYLRKDRDGDWVNKTQAGQFLDLGDNKCRIYEVRPRDCAGFPHHTKKKMVDYMHVFKQNIEFCPATYKVVEIIKEKLNRYTRPQ